MFVSLHQLHNIRHLLLVPTYTEFVVPAHIMASSGQVHRITQFKIADEEAKAKLLEMYKKMKTKAVKVRTTMLPLIINWLNSPF